ncbi:MAG: 30S ribosomal protein S19 [Candidatus Altiarchaeales archaeon]|nr:MAG: 30S ribosomal protein S19 [Candidatus Altiarchaeales archaeon]RLI95104.1 MAG: 30S ribosomal protein S19 [Candidatus Altiarchaeales archaeon]RLI95478.1 MAG: 30S ribosomal protein S19 [Candidatus Altiarchaeales archaeon]HDO82585.1 30S ribosomal protein S19 [Candidatus Altiarchaeales archaeon]HEX55234.1 30S ribosomal protein S19 [Candidatus Altiarchaeales archaeon]
MARRIFKYKGYTLDELKKMSMDELVNIMPSDIRRKLKRGFTEHEKKLLIKVKKTLSKINEGKSVKPIRTHCRDMPILPIMLGLEFEVYNGKEFKRVKILPEMIGHRLGEFSMTRQIVKHGAPGVGATRSSLFVPIK